MKVDEIKTGFVIDHIESGMGMRLYELLGLGSLDCPIAIIMNAPSRKMGSKDIIKIDADIEINLEVIGFVDPSATVNVIRDGVLVEKKSITAPETLTNVLKCTNPRCISTTEQDLPQVFRRSAGSERVYRCAYCDAKQK